MSNTYETPTVVLRNPHMYMEWITSLQTRAKTADVWHLFDPDTDDMPITKPIKPAMPSLAQFVEEGEPEPLGAHILPSAQKKIWDSQLEYYKLRAENMRYENSEYQMQQQSIRSIVVYIQQSVTSHIFATSCLPDQSFHQWIKNIADTVGIDLEEAQERARTEYKAILKQGPQKKGNNWNLWLEKYNKYATIAEKHNCVELTDLNLVRRDFVESVADIDRLWVESIRQVSKTKLLTRREIMTDWRSFMENHHPLKSEKTVLAVTEEDRSGLRGDAFQVSSGYSAPANKGNNGMRTSSYGQQQLSRVRVKRSHNQYNQEEGEHDWCPVCRTGPHSVDNCFYLMKESDRPEWFRPRKDIEGDYRGSLINYRLSLNPELRVYDKRENKNENKRQRLSTRSKSKTPAMKQSHTPTPDVQEDEN
jgi:hypothetical protein